MLRVERLLQGLAWPQIWGQNRVGLLYGLVGGLREVAQCTGGADRCGVAVLDAGHAQQLLWHLRSDQARTTRRRNQSDGDRATFSGDLSAKRVKRLAERLSGRMNETETDHSCS